MGLCREWSITRVLAEYDEYTDDDIIDHWYDWFCKPESLPRKGQRLLAKLKAISGSKRFDPDTTYVWFKNNCPGIGSLYDDFRIADIETGDVIYCIIPSSGHSREKGEASVWGYHPTTGRFEELVIGTWKDVKAFFGGNDEVVKETRRLIDFREAEFENRRYDNDQKTIAGEADQEDSVHRQRLESLCQ